MSMEWVRKNYGVPAKRGGRVEYAGDNGSGPRMGTIMRADGPRLRIRLDGDDWSGAYHPTWALRYLDTPSPAPNLGVLTADEKNFGIIRSFVPESTEDNRVGVKQYQGGNGVITFSIFIGNHRWAECSMLPADAAKVATLIMSKPAVAALAASEGSTDAE